MPEMVVSIGASLTNLPDIAIGNVVGSNIFNIGVILGITALICPIHVNLKLVKIDIPIMIVAALVSLILVSTGTVSRLTGILLFSGLIAYTAFTVFMAEKENRPDIKIEFQEGIPGVSKSLSLDFVFIGGGLLLLILGSRFLVLSATDLARILGISEAVIALTVIAAGTSLPELATSFVAALRRQPDIAVGNVVGSNLFNTLGILGASAMVRPLNVVGITPMDLWAMMAFSILLLPLAYGGLKLYRWKGGLLLAGYGAYLWALWP